ncbi:hypothetical protein [Bacteroides sp.]|uniref:hypothetical protein n=1 Tax=Bacteroides sp. TaxID=29523 RepID=UPI0025B9EFFB|nr:hypothetical protein [Bacteroides sp.]
MDITIVVIDGKPVGYNLVAQNQQDADKLRCIQNMHFLASNKQEQIKYDGVSKDKKKNTSCVYFLQHQYAILPPEGEVKQAILQQSENYNSSTQK